MLCFQQISRNFQQGLVMFQMQKQTYTLPKLSLKEGLKN